MTIPGEPGLKRRPGLVISMDARNRFATDVLVIPASTTLRPSPTHVKLAKGTGGIPLDSVLKCEQITTLLASDVRGEPLGGQLSPAKIGQVERAVMRAIGVPVPLEP